MLLDGLGFQPARVGEQGAALLRMSCAGARLGLRPRPLARLAEQS